MPILLRTKRATHTIYARLWMFSIAMALWIIPSAVAGPLDNWQWQNPVPSTDQLYGVAFGNNRWIAVGSFGAVVTSNDGTNWQKQMPPTATPSHAFSIAFGNGIFVVPYWTHCFRTTDGTNWSSASFADPPDIFGIERVVFINGEFFGLGQRRHIIASPDGIHWTIRNPPSQQSSFSIRSLSFGNGIYVALSGSTEVMISTDGKAWNAIGLFFPGIVRLAEITFYNDLFYAVSEAGAVYNSPDGVSWTEVAILSCRADRIISNKNGLYVISENCAGKEIIFSADGRTWVERAVGVRTFLRDICIHPSGSLIAVGSTFWDRESILGTAIFSSPDGVEWRRQDRGFHNLLDDVTYGGGKFVAVGGLFTTNATVLVSTNGAEWTRANLASTSRLRRVAYGNGTYVIIAQNTSRTPPVSVFTSNNALDWTLQTIATNIGVVLLGVTHANGKFVGVGSNNTVAYSTDGINWSSQSLHSHDDLRSLAFGNGIFVAVGDKSAVDTTYADNILTSMDGVSWTRQTIGQAAKRLPVIAFGNGRFVAVGETNSFTSTHGIRWTSHVFPTNESKEKLVFGNGYFVLVTRVQALGSAFSKVYSSTNGETWTAHATGTANYLWSAAFGAGRFVVTTDLGGILRSDLIPNSSTAFGKLAARYLSERNAIELSFSGEPAAGYHIQSADRLELPEWRDLGPLTNDGIISIDNTGPYRFYRAVKSQVD